MDDEPDHRFSEGQGFEEPYEGFDLEDPELSVDPSQVDPVDSRVLTDMLDERQLATAGTSHRRPRQLPLDSRTDREQYRLLGTIQIVQ